METTAETTAETRDAALFKATPLLSCGFMRVPLLDVRRQNRPIEDASLDTFQRRVGSRPVAATELAAERNG